MTLFVAFAAALTLGVLSLFAWVIVRGVRLGAARPASDAEAGLVSAELEVLRAQRRELDHEVEIDSVDARHGDEALRELSERADALLRRRQQLAGAVGSLPAADGGRVWIYWLMGLAVVLLAAAFYAKLGTPAAIGHPPAGSASRDGAEGLSVDELVARLERTLAEHPDQAEGWLLLAHTKGKLGDFPAAAAAYRKAIALAEKRSDLAKLMPDLYSDLADALVMQQNGSFAGEPSALIEQSLKIDPEHPKALALAASAAMRAGDKDQALGYWRRLLKALPPDSPYRPQVEGVIADLGGASTPGSAGSTAGAKPSAGSGARIEGMVEISPELKARVHPGDTLFVFARRSASAAAAAGSRMPLAVARFPLDDAAAWPRPFELTDAMAMAPGSKLSDADEVELVARISRQGSAIAASGDLSSAPLAVKPSDPEHSRGVRLVVDRVVP